MRESLLIGLLSTLVVGGCGRSNDSANPATGPSTVTSGQRSPSTLLTVSGSRSLTAIGETSQLAAIATWPDGTLDVTSEVRWNSQNPSVVTMSPNGLATAVGFGMARIDARFESGGGSASASFQIAVTSAGTFVVTGDVREPGQGTLAGVRVLEPVSGRSTLTDQAGTYTLALLAGTRLRFDKDGYERGELISRRIVLAI